MNNYDTREKMFRLNVRQVQLIAELRRRKGISVNPSQMSLILSGALVSDKARKVLAACEEVLAEMEKEVG